MPMAAGQVFWKTAKEVIVSFSPLEGSLVLHAHGRRCLTHEGAEVTRGCKHLFRSSPPLVRGNGRFAPREGCKRQIGRCMSGADGEILKKARLTFLRCPDAMCFMELCRASRRV